MDDDLPQNSDVASDNKRPVFEFCTAWEAKLMQVDLIDGTLKDTNLQLLVHG